MELSRYVCSYVIRMFIHVTDQSMIHMLLTSYTEYATAHYYFNRGFLYRYILCHTGCIGF